MVHTRLSMVYAQTQIVSKLKSFIGILPRYHMRANSITTIITLVYDQKMLYTQKDTDHSKMLSLFLGYKKRITNFIFASSITLYKMNLPSQTVTFNI